MRIPTFIASDTCTAYKIVAYIRVEFLTAAGVMLLWRGTGLVGVGVGVGGGGGGGECRNGLVVVNVGSQR